MDFYVVSPNILNNGDNFADEMLDNNVVEVGWSKDKQKGVQFSSIKNGDCIVVALRQNWKWTYYYLGIVKGDNPNPIEGKQSKFLTNVVNLQNIDLHFENWSSNGSSQIPSPQRIRREDNEKIIKIINEIINQGDTTMPNTNDKIAHYQKLLQTNNNLILTGAPGTGKTFLAKEIAKAMGCTDDEIGIVQFHPSYDYTDFVEGLRPKNDDNGNVGFERKDGVFKEFCKRALKANFSDGVDNFDEVWGKLVEYLNENDFIDVPSIKFGKVFNISLNATGTGLMCPDRSGFYFSKEQLYKVYRGEKGIPSGAFDNVRKAIIKKMHSDFDLEDYKVGTETNEKKNFVFIIDEINRGEISKIFGELFFSIDPGYRGVDGKVQTQYQNLVEEGDDSFDGFYVPENVYIIGTMNDIDRSVESMDFAFRRRFAFCEIMASENVGMLDALGDLKDEAVSRMNNLNNAIEQIEGLSSAYHIGASYFLKLQNYDGDFEQLWKYHIEGLLREYLRGNPNADDLIGDLKSAYDNENPVTDRQDDESQVEETE